MVEPADPKQEPKTGEQPIIRFVFDGPGQTNYTLQMQGLSPNQVSMAAVHLLALASAQLLGGSKGGPHGPQIVVPRMTLPRKGGH